MDMLFSLALVLLAVLLWRRTTESRSFAATIGLCVFAALFLLIGYYVADSLTGSGIDASVVYHLVTGLEDAGTGDFTSIGVVAAVMLVGALILSVYSYRSARSKRVAAFGSARAIFAFAVLSAAVYLNPASADLVALARNAGLQAATGVESDTVPEDFVQIEALDFPAGKKNFVLLYLESLERSYFDEDVFPGLMPNLAALEKDALSFTNITDLSETGWTIAAMVGGQCGMPLLASGAGIDQFLPGATCLGDLLNESGYDLTYMGGADLDFAGKGTFYQTHGFDLIEGREELKGGLEDPEYLSAWGLYDDSLYAEATRRFDSLAAGDDPFGLVLLTVDTHHPFGYISNACGDSVYEDGENKFLDAVHCADKMAVEFIRHVLDSPGFEDTVLIVASDHMAMPNLAWDRLETTRRSNLLFFFGDDIEPGVNAEPGTTLDLGPTIMGLIGAQANGLGYGRDLLGPEPTLRAGETPIESVIDDGRPFLSAMWALPGIQDGMHMNPENDRLVLGDRFVKVPALFLLDDAFETTQINFDLHSEIRLIERIGELPFDQKFLWVDQCDETVGLAPGSPDAADEYCAVFGTLGSPELGVTALPEGHRVEYQDMQDQFARAVPSQEYFDRVTAELLREREFGAEKVVQYEPPGLVGDIAIRSAGYMAGQSWILNREAGDRVPLERGLTLIGLNAGQEPVKIGHKDTCSYGGEKFDTVRLETDLRTAIERNRAYFGAFVIVAHNSVVCYEIDPHLEPLFAGTPFTAWRDLWYEQPYVAVLTGDGQVQEFTGDRQTAMGVELRDIIKPLTGVVQRQIDRLPRIAHAGGGYNGLTYTNSFEALNANAQDYELFEIDLSWTSDGQLVCLHDWSQPLLESAGVIEGEPLSLTVFESVARRYPDFHSCTLASLTDWLREHPGERIVLDLKKDAVEAYRYIADRYPDLRNRFVPQVYQPEEYRVVRDLGYEDIIWTLYTYDGGLEDVLDWLPRMDLYGLTMAPAWVEKDLPLLAKDKTGVLSWVHTVNTAAELNDLLASGVTEIYTDFLPSTAIAQFTLASSSYGTGKSFVSRAGDRTETVLTRGVNLVGLSGENEPEFLARFDGCAETEDGQAPDPSWFRDTFAQVNGQYDALAIIVHDSAFCGSVTLDPVLSGLGLAKWTEIGHREPYIGVIYKDGQVMEFNGSSNERLSEVISFTF